MLNHVPADFPFVSHFPLHLTHASAFRVPRTDITDALYDVLCSSGLLFLVAAETDWRPKIETSLTTLQRTPVPDS